MFSLSQVIEISRQYVSQSSNLYFTENSSWVPLTEYEFKPNLKAPFHERLNPGSSFYLKFEFPVMTFWTEINVGTFVYNSS